MTFRQTVLALGAPILSIALVGCQPPLEKEKGDGTGGTAAPTAGETPVNPAPTPGPAPTDVKPSTEPAPAPTPPADPTGAPVPTPAEPK